MNWKILFLGQTKIEAVERKRFPSKIKNKYDIGYYRNFTNIFGNNPLFWFIPFFPNGNGFVFELIIVFKLNNHKYKKYYKNKKNIKNFFYLKFNKKIFFLI